MKDNTKIKLNNIKTKDMTGYGIKRYKKTAKPQPKHVVKDTEPSTFLRRTLTKSAVSIAICLSVLVISSVDNEIFNEATEGIDYLISHEMDIAETFSFVKGMKDVVPVISDANLQFSPPTNGIILSDLRDEADEVVGKLYSAPDGNCYASCDGVVFFVDKVSASCPYIRIRHEYGYDTIYMGLVSDVAVGDVVSRQQKVGTCIGDNIGFILMKNSGYIDSGKYIDVIE